MFHYTIRHSEALHYNLQQISIPIFLKKKLVATKQTEEKTNKTNKHWQEKKKIGKIPFFTQSPCRR